MILGLEYIQLSRAWYGDANLRNRRDNVYEEIWVGYSDPNDVLVTELVFEWHKLGLRQTGCRLGIFDDSWSVFNQRWFRDLSKKLSKIHWTVRPKDIMETLEAVGARDVTPEHRE